MADAQVSGIEPGDFEQVWKLEVTDRLARAETKLNLIAYVSGASLVALLAVLVKVL
jgi:hypothetical protein